jgi:general secretion pathway protein F
MATFSYRAIDAGGAAVDGEIEAPTLDAAVDRLRRRGELPVRIAPGAAPRPRAAGLFRRPRRLAPRAAASLFGALAMLLAAGLVLDGALDLLARTGEGAGVRRTAAALAQRVRAGSGLAGAMAALPGRFDPVSLAMVRAGEEGGRLDAALAGLARLAERSRQTAEKTRSALIYPAMVVLTAGATLTLLATVVVPAFAPLFADAGAELPLALALLLAAGDTLAAHGALIALAGLAALLAARAVLARPDAARARDRLLLRLPRIGALIAAAEAARFARALGCLMEGGVTLAAALPLAEAALANRALAAAVGAAAEEVRAGRPLGEALAADERLPPVLVQLLRIGEASGRAGPLLLRAAEICEGDVERGLERATALLVPGLIIALGALVALLVASLLGAILDANRLVL